MSIIEQPDPDVLSGIAARAGLRALKQGYKLNRAYTPKNCRIVAQRITGKKFKSRDFDGMIAALDEVLP